MVRSWRGVAAVLIWMAGGAAAATPADDVAEAAARIERARQGLAAAHRPELRVEALSAAITAYQSALAVLRAGVNGASARERELALDLETRRDEIQHLISALEALGRTPPPAQALHPQGPIGAARAAAMLSRLTPDLKAEADALSRDYAEIAAIRELRLSGQRDLATAIAALGAARTELGETLAGQAPAQPRGTEDPEVAMMVRDSDTLSVLAGKLAAEPALKTGQGADEAGMPPLRRPVDGQIIRAYNQPDAAGVKRPGVVLAAPPLSLVSAPADAIVRYAGPFLEYGYVVVLEADDNTLIVLAGMAQVQVTLGEALRAGDLVGLLGGPAFEATEVIAADSESADAPEQAVESDDEMDVEAGSGAEETLYVEIRHGRGPVDPGPLFAGENG